MSEDQAKATTETPANGEGKANSKERKQRDETPIEELYDLSKPIPKVGYAEWFGLYVTLFVCGRR